MKKAMVLILFLAGGFCFISAGMYMNRQQWGMTETEGGKSTSPELLSDIDMPSYVSLPASFANIDIVEDLDDISVTEDNVEDVMYEQLLSTAGNMATIEDDDLMLVVNYTVTQGNSVKEVESGYKMGFKQGSPLYDETVYDALNELSVGVPVHLDGVYFNGYSDVTLDLTVTEIYNMPYPVTDDYIEEKTEYNGVSDMKAELLNDASGEAKAIARQQTINGLIDTMVEQTTFIRIPDSLVVQELAVLQEDNPNATYDEAKHSLRRIFFIAAVIRNYDIATNADIDRRYDSLSDEQKSGLSDYEAERQKYLLYEEDVVTCIYRKVNISDQQAEEAA